MECCDFYYGLMGGLIHPGPRNFLPISFACRWVTSKGEPNFASTRACDVRVNGNDMLVAPFDFIMRENLNEIGGQVWGRLRGG